MSWVAVAIGGAAVVGAGTAVYLDSQQGGASDQYGGTQTVRSSSTAMPRPVEYDVIFDEFMTNYFGKQVNLTARKKLGDRLSEVKHELEWKKNVYESQPGGLTAEHISLLKEQENEIARIQAQYDSLGVGEAPYKKELDTLLKEKEAAKKAYLEQITGLKDPLLSTVEAAMGKHAGLLDEMINKQMAGEAVGPYGADIDKLLAERTGVSFGGAEPMQFITGSQQRLLGNLMGAQETGLSNIALTSLGRSEAEKEPSALRYGMERELADLGLAAFTPSNVSELAYLQDLRSMWEPMETMRYTAQPSTNTTTTGLPLQQGPSYLDQLGQVMNMGTGVANWASLLKSFQSTPSVASSGAAPAYTPAIGPFAI